MRVVRLGAVCSVDLAVERPRREFSLTVSEFADLDDGRRVTLHAARGFGGRLSVDGDAWEQLMAGELEQTALAVVRPDDGSGEEHPWAWLVELCAAQGIVTTAAELRSVPYVVELGESVLARLARNPPG